jgi:hypothetical protein
VTLQITLGSSSDGIVAVARASVTNGDASLERVDFYTTVLPNGTRSGPLSADRTPDVGIFEHDVLLDTSLQTKVEAIAVLRDSTQIASTPAFINLNARSATVSPPALAAFRAVSQWWRIDFSVAPGAASSWKCWLRQGTWPTSDNTPTGLLVEDHLKFEGNRDQLSFSHPIPGGGAGTWYAIAIGYAADGTPGPRLSDFTDGTYDAPVRELLFPSVTLTTQLDRKKNEVKGKLADFTSWLTTYNLKGIISEVGWPVEFVDAWNEVARAWFADANAAQLWATVWATGEMWGSYHLQPYALENGVWVAKPQSAVVEEAANLTGANYKRGVNVAGAEFGAPDTPATSSFSNANPGVPGSEYVWNCASTYQYLYGRGHRLIRIPFRWERLQPVLGAALDANELARMHASVDAAAAAGVEVILDVHNYGAYYLNESGIGVRRTIGTTQVTFDHFGDLWGRIAAEFNGTPAVIGYGLMNEPVEMTPAPGLTAAQTWETAAQHAADAIRAAALPQGASARWIIVGGYEWSGTWSPGVNHRGPFVTDSAAKVMYEAHQYFDDDSSGQYHDPTLSLTAQENFVQWEPNVAMWDIGSALGEGGDVYTVEVYRVGAAAPIGSSPLWKRGASDGPLQSCTQGSSGCAHRTFEYRIIVTDNRDGSRTEYATSISGPYQQ